MRIIKVCRQEERIGGRSAVELQRCNTSARCSKDRYMISVPSSVRGVTNNRFRGERVRIEELENLLLLQTPHKADLIGL